MSLGTSSPAGEGRVVVVRMLMLVDKNAGILQYQGTIRMRVRTIMAVLMLAKARKGDHHSKATVRMWVCTTVAVLMLAKAKKGDRHSKATVVAKAYTNMAGTNLHRKISIPPTRLKTRDLGMKLTPHLSSYTTATNALGETCKITLLHSLLHMVLKVGQWVELEVGQWVELEAGQWVELEGGTCILQETWKSSPG